MAGNTLRMQEQTRTDLKLNVGSKERNLLGLSHGWTKWDFLLGKVTRSHQSFLEFFCFTNFSSTILKSYYEWESSSHISFPGILSLLWALDSLLVSTQAQPNRLNFNRATWLIQLVCERIQFLQAYQTESSSQFRLAHWTWNNKKIHHE